ncbi:MAG: class I SAM-dependent methyltransferase [Sutterellaceae bacterium]|nr:methyltransferase domain-containing protein [Burkholderiaceae bacterium]MCX7901665.1 methyltransferase domain-containing protein [Burkholderiaceae bacterium]MDW8430301.1 class I SAM-dependent methyltransferase [Sutterellaceae bacterium]
MSAFERRQQPADQAAEHRFDDQTDPRFVAYYARASLSPATRERFTIVQRKVLSLLRARGYDGRPLRVCDIGCGAGTQARLWAEKGHRVCGIDVSRPLIELARQRAAEASLCIRFDIGTATALPYADRSFDVCLLPELLEHVPDWQACLHEAARVLDYGGVLYLSTTNALCPMQQEFNLPLYSWYPPFVKRRCERLAMTTRPALANYAKYPAVHWFTWYTLRDFLTQRGFECFDRLDMVETDRLGVVLRLLVQAARVLAPLRFCAHVATEGTTVFAIKRAVS